MPLRVQQALDGAGPLPLAIDPRFPQANLQFLERLRQQGTSMGQLAMVRAMAAGADKGVDEATADQDKAGQGKAGQGKDIAMGNGTGSVATSKATSNRGPGSAA